VLQEAQLLALRHVVAKWGAAGILVVHEGRLSLHGHSTPVVLPSADLSKAPTLAPSFMLKQDCAAFPSTSCPHKPVLVQRQEHASRVVQELAAYFQTHLAPACGHLVGFDTEQKPQFQAGKQQNPPAVLQVRVQWRNLLLSALPAWQHHICTLALRPGSHLSDWLQMRCSPQAWNRTTQSSLLSSHCAQPGATTSHQSQHGLQVAHGDKVFVFQLTRIGNTRAFQPASQPHFSWLQALMSIPGVRFCGVGITGDMKSLQAWYIGGSASHPTDISDSWCASDATSYLFGSKAGVSPSRSSRH
jgi:hypothetical protein